MGSRLTVKLWQSKMSSGGCDHSAVLPVAAELEPLGSGGHSTNQFPVDDRDGGAATTHREVGLANKKVSDLAYVRLRPHLQYIPVCHITAR